MSKNQILKNKSGAGELIVKKINKRLSLANNSEKADNK